MLFSKNYYAFDRGDAFIGIYCRDDQGPLWVADVYADRLEHGGPDPSTRHSEAIAAARSALAESLAPTWTGGAIPDGPAVLVETARLKRLVDGYEEETRALREQARRASVERATLLGRLEQARIDAQQACGTRESRRVQCQGAGSGRIGDMIEPIDFHENDADPSDSTIGGMANESGGSLHAEAVTIPIGDMGTPASVAEIGVNSGDEYFPAYLGPNDARALAAWLIAWADRVESKS